jgi:hypothetical protein
LRKTFLIFVFIPLCFAFTVFNPIDTPQPNLTQATIPQAVIRKLKRDAARLALRVDSEREDLRYQNIAIPQDRMNGIFNILSSVYLLNDTGKSIEKCNVHTFPNPSIDHLVVIFDKNVAWAAPLRSGITETSDKNINKLLNDYDLTIEKYVQWNDTQDAITIRSKEPLNMAALANEFNNVEGVAELDLGLPKVSGNDISMKRVSAAWEIDFILKFGAYAGATSGKQHAWKYRALDNGEVTFLAESGDPIPTWLKCDAGATNSFMAGGQ